MVELFKYSTSTEDGARFLHGRGEHTESIVNRTLGLIEDLLSGSTKHQSACLAERDSGEAQEFVLANHDL